MGEILFTCFSVNPHREILFFLSTLLRPVLGVVGRGVQRTYIGCISLLFQSPPPKKYHHHNRNNTFYFLKPSSASKIVFLWFYLCKGSLYAIKLLSIGIEGDSCANNAVMVEVRFLISACGVVFLDLLAFSGLGQDHFSLELICQIQICCFLCNGSCNSIFPRA